MNKVGKMMVASAILLTGCSGAAPKIDAFSVESSHLGNDIMILSRNIAITSKVDSLSITDVVVNRGNCKVEHSHSLGTTAALLTPRGQELMTEISAANAEVTRTGNSNEDTPQYAAWKVAHDELDKISDVSINVFPKALKFGETFNISIDRECGVSEISVSSDKGNMVYSY